MTAAHSFTTPIDQVVEKLELITKTKITNKGSDLRGKNDECRVSMYITDSILRLHVSKFEKKDYQIISSTFAPERDSKCALTSSGSSITVKCIGLECEEEGCVEVRNNITISDNSVTVRELTCRFK
jgi:hypothetical protein